MKYSKHFSYRLALDMGTGSIGWAVLRLNDDNEPFGVVRAGARIFGTGRLPKDNTTLAANRRIARSARRRRDRQIQRRGNTIAALIRHGLFPKEKELRHELKNLNPWQLRHEALNRELMPYEIGRALYHLQQRRGFKSNRKTDRGNAEAGPMKQAIQEFKETLPSEETVGSYLWQQILDGNGARARHTKVGSKIEYDFYIDRSMIIDEFERIWSSQKRFHSDLMTEEAYKEIYEAIFNQRNLKEVIPGKCFFERDESRASKGLPSSHLFRVLQEINNLRVIDQANPFEGQRALTREERDKALDLLLKKKEMVFSSLAKQVFGKGTQLKFNLEAGERAKIKGEQIAAQMSSTKAFGKKWFEIGLSEQDQIVKDIDELLDENEAILHADAISSKYGLSNEQALYIVNEIKIDEGYGRLSTKAILALIPHLRDGWDGVTDTALTYSQAAERAGYNVNFGYTTGVVYDELPYYGEILRQYTADVPRLEDQNVLANTNLKEAEYGRIANPTVHIGLNELRKIVNLIIHKYGKPQQIHIEVARELSQSDKVKAEISKIRNQNEKLNERLTAELNKLGLPTNRSNREKLKLFEELSKSLHQCVYCGTSIELSRLFTNSYQVDHILPFSRTLDDGFANKVLVCIRCNQEKGNQSPYELWGADIERWGEIYDRASNFANNKSRRFEADAMQKIEESGGFLARQLTDTAYLSRVARQYLGALYTDPTEIQRRIVVTPGRLTAMLRAKWGLNSILGDGKTKNRDDHRHHAVDAIVIGVTDRSILKKISDANRRARQSGLERILEEMPLPWSSFRQDSIDAINKVMVSHKPDHGVGGRLHEETAYGVLKGPNAKGEYLTTKKKESGEIEEKWRRVIPIYHRGDGPETAVPYKAYIGGSNHCIEIYRNDKGKWVGEVISTHQANQTGYKDFKNDRKQYLKETFSGHPLVMRVHGGDILRIDENGIPKLVKLVKMSSAGQIFFREINDAQVDSKSLSSKTASTLQLLNTRRVFIDPIGQLKDPGWRD